MKLSQAINLAGAIVSKDDYTPVLGYVRIDPDGVWATDRYMLVHVPAEDIDAELPETTVYIPPTMLPIVKKHKQLNTTAANITTLDGIVLTVESCGGDYPDLAKLLETFDLDESTESDTFNYRYDLLNRIKPQLWGGKPRDVVTWKKHGKVLKLDISDATVIYLEPTN